MITDMITLKDKIIEEKLKLVNQIEVSTSSDSFVTLKADHKPDFIYNRTCRVINPRKSEISIISNNIFDRV